MLFYINSFVYIARNSGFRDVFHGGPFRFSRVCGSLALSEGRSRPFPEFRAMLFYVYVYSLMCTARHAGFR
ncbi:hypothetical protein OG21DRAFT_1511131 [Imleria badia]|nr:hypothetical protein OG21DRAFT_1511131 [Imleria badia]